jgi:alpha-beta hydrolase superfamily lysophospholipase
MAMPPHGGPGAGATSESRRTRAPGAVHRWPLVALLVVLALELGALVVVVRQPTATRPTTLAAQYVAPDPLPKAAPGTPVRVWKLPAGPIHGAVYGILYHSRAVDGSDTVVSGYLAVPPGTAPAGGRPVVALAHGTVGTADVCAPSREPATDAATINPFLAKGWVVAATDFEGIGGPGRDPYLVGASEGRSMIDAVRAARRLLGSGASNRFVAWGISQGGHAALFARQIAPTWAPELDMEGAVAMAPVSDVIGFVDKPTIAPQAITLLVAAGYAAAYPALHPQQVLSPTAMARLADIDDQCLPQLSATLGHLSVGQLRRVEPGNLPAWRRELLLNTPGRVASPVPVLIVQGTRDPIVPLTTSTKLFQRLCSTTQAAELDVVDHASHGDVVADSRATYLSWMQQRFAGLAPPSNCVNPT